MLCFYVSGTILISQFCRDYNGDFQTWVGENYEYIFEIVSTITNLKANI